MHYNIKAIIGILALTLPSLSLSDSFYDDFESSTIGADANGGNSFFQWEDSVSSNVSDTRAYSGDKSLEFHFKGKVDKGEDAWSEQRFMLGKVESELWVRYKLYIPENYKHRVPNGAANNKGLINVWSGSYSGYSATTSIHFQLPVDADLGNSGSNPNGSMLYGAWRANSTSVYNFFNQYDLADDSFQVDETAKGITIEDRGTWVDWVIHLKSSTLPISFKGRTEDGNGQVQVWKNGDLIYSVIDATNYFPDQNLNGWDQGYLMGWANSGFDEDTFFYLDEFKIGQSPSDIGFDINQPQFGSVFKK